MTRIAEARKELGLNGFQFAVKTGIHPAHISRIENRRAVPSENMKAAILKALHLTEEEGFDENGLARKQ